MGGTVSASNIKLVNGYYTANICENKNCQTFDRLIKWKPKKNSQMLSFLPKVNGENGTYLFPTKDMNTGKTLSSQEIINMMYQYENSQDIKIQPDISKYPPAPPDYCVITDPCFDKKYCCPSNISNDQQTNQSSITPASGNSVNSSDNMKSEPSNFWKSWWILGLLLFIIFVILIIGIMIYFLMK